MHFSTLLLATGALAAPSPSPNLDWLNWGGGDDQPVQVNSTGCVALITGDSYKIGNLTQQIGDIAKDVEQNDVLNLLKLQGTTGDLISAVKDAGNAVNGSCGNLTLTDALPLVNILKALDDPVKTTMDTLTSKKESVFDHAVLYAVSLSWLVKVDLDKVVDATQGFAYAIRSKTPPEAGSIVDGVAKGILDPIVKARDTFADNTGLLDLEPSNN